MDSPLKQWVDKAQPLWVINHELLLIMNEWLATQDGLMVSNLFQKFFLIKICIKGLVKICPKEKSKEMENGKGLIFKMIFQWHKRYEYKFSLIWVIIQREKSSNYLSTTKK